MRLVVAVTAFFAALLLTAAAGGWPAWAFALLIAATLLCGMGAPAIRDYRREQDRGQGHGQDPPAGYGGGPGA